MENINKYSIKVDDKTYDFFEFIRGELQCPRIAVPLLDTPEEYESWFRWFKEEVSSIIYPCTTKMMYDPFGSCWSIWGKKIKEADKEGAQ